MVRERAVESNGVSNVGQALNTVSERNSTNSDDSISEEISVESDSSPGASSVPKPAIPASPLRSVVELYPGDFIDHYEIIRQLGRGGMGSVYLARDRSLGRVVAIKLLRKTTREFAELFIREARATAQCLHENIVVLYGAAECEGCPYLVLEYVPGNNLRHYMGEARSGTALPAVRVLDIAIPIVRALICAHSNGVIHRDLKPDNIVIADNGAIKVLDFGIAKVQEELQSEDEAEPLERIFESFENPACGTVLGAVKGTTLYMAPEQWRAEPIDGRTDIWAVGIILFRLLTGKHPLSNLKDDQLRVVADLDEPMPSINSVAENVPAELASLVDKCLQKRKNGRPDAKNLLKSLENYSRKAKSARLRRRLILASLLGMATITAGLFVGIVAIRGAQKEAERQATLARVAEEIAERAARAARESEKHARRSEALARDAEAVARNAEAEANKRLEELQEKEKERLLAERVASNERARADIAHKEKKEAETLAEKRASEAARAEAEKDNLKSIVLDAARRRGKQVGGKPAAAEGLE